MVSQNRFFDDFARIAGGAAGALTGVKSEVETLIRQQFERILSDMELINREEFDVVREMASLARNTQEALSERMSEIAKKLAAMADVSTGKPSAAKPGHVTVRRPRRSAAAALSRSRKHNAGRGKKTV
ncbi:MAG: accessory factor UbiK family protein [Alphaproteobacteria bacterium]|nr:accessory factor UbiK family protein [Alphaproteobacteria bacterium]